MYIEEDVAQYGEEMAETVGPSRITPDLLRWGLIHSERTKDAQGRRVRIKKKKVPTCHAANRYLSIGNEPKAARQAG